MQICFNARKCPLLRRELPLFQRLLWATGYWVGCPVLLQKHRGVLRTMVCRLQRNLCVCSRSDLPHRVLVLSIACCCCCRDTSATVFAHR
jgi:hypothetical protein